MGPLGAPEMILIFVIILLLFGAEKLPQMARGFGKAMGEFKKARDEFEREITRSTEEVRNSLSYTSTPAAPQNPVVDVPTIREAPHKEPHEELHDQAVAMNADTSHFHPEPGHPEPGHHEPLFHETGHETGHGLVETAHAPADLTHPETVHVDAPHKDTHAA